MKHGRRIDISVLLYYMALLCEVIAMQIDLTTLPFTYSERVFSLITKALRYAGYILVSCKIIRTKFLYKEFILLLIVAVALGINVPFIGRGMFLVFLFIYGMKEIDFDKISQNMSIWLMIGCGITVLGSYLGILENWGYGLLSSRPRYSLGYFYPSHATSAFLYTILLFCYVHRGKLKLWHIVIIELINYWQFTKTDSRTGTAMVAIVAISFYLLQFVHKDVIKKKIGYILCFTFPISASVSLIAAFLYNPNSIFWIKANTFFNQRLRLAHNAIMQYGIHLFGQNIDWIGYGGLGHIYESLPAPYNYVDCSYVKILLENGIIFLFIVILGFTLASIRAKKSGNIYLCLALAFTATYSIVEPRLCQIGFNPFMLVLIALIDYKGNFLGTHNFFNNKYKIMKNAST